MTAPTPYDARWLTPPPTDGSDVWSGDGYSATNELVSPYRGYTFADYAGYNGSLSAPAAAPPYIAPAYGGARAYVPAHSRGEPEYGPVAGSSRAAETYLYYAGTGDGSLDPSLPPYWPQSIGVREPVDAFAVASLVVAILGGLVAIPLALVALRRVARRPLRGRGLAIAALAVSGAWVIIAAALVVLTMVLGTTTASRDSVGAIDHRGSLGAQSLRTGDCAQLPTDLTKITDVVTVLPCAQSHNAQVFSTGESTDTAYPGSAQLEQEGLAACATSLPSSATASMQVVTLVPDETSWANGRRTRVCLLLDPQA
jgi:hypothetical protein